MSPKLIVTNTEMSPKLEFYQNWNDTKTEMMTKLKCHLNSIVTKTEIGLNNWNFKFNSKSLALIALALLIDWLSESFILCENTFKTLSLPNRNS